MEDRGELLSCSKELDTCRQVVIPALGQILKECEDLIVKYGNGQSNTKKLLCQRLCILRNVFAFADSCTTQSLLEGRLLSLLQGVIEHSASEVDGQIPRVVSQLLANATTASEAWCGAVAKTIFPKGYFMLMRDHKSVGPLALSLYNMCTRLGSGFMECLVTRQADVVAKLLLLTASRQEDYGELDLLLVHLCFKHDYMELLMHSMGDKDLKYASLLLPRALTALAAEEDNTTEKKICSHAGCRWIFVELVKEIGQVDGKFKNEPSSLQIGVMRDALHLFRDLAARHDEGASLTGGISLVEELIDAGIIETLLVMLESIGDDGGGRLVQSHLWAEVAFQQAQLYPGFTSDILSVIANACYRRKRVQEDIIHLNGIMLILNHLQGNSESPLAREWALWTVRNLCETSELARQAIQELQKIDDAPATSGDYDVVYEKENGRVRIGLKQ